MADVVTDSFTDTNGTLIEAHTGEVGATWTVDTSFGVGDPAAFVIQSNTVRRPTFAENPAADGGEALMRPSGLLPPGTTQFSIQFDVKWDDTSNQGYVAIYEQGINPGNSYFLFYINNTGGIAYRNHSGTTSTVGFTPTIAQWYTVRLDVDGPDVELFVDDVSQDTWTRDSDAMPLEPFGFDIADTSSVGNTHLKNVRIFPATPPGAFWTEYVRTTETIS